MSRKNYFYSSSKAPKNYEDPYESPLNKKNTGNQPLGTGARDEGSEVVLLGANTSLEATDGKVNRANQEADLEEIMLG